MKGKEIKVADHAPFPAGRFKCDGPGSGEAFREEVLIPAFESGQVVTLDFTGTRPYPLSWAEEAFGGLARSGKFSKEFILSKLTIIAKPDLKRSEIINIIKSS